MRNSKRFISTIILCLGLTACGTSATDDQTKTSDKKDLPYKMEKINQVVMDGNAVFAWDLFKKLSEEEKQKSIFISPFSISTALSMTYQGARGETKEEMKEVLGYQGVDINKVNDTYKNYIRYVTQMNDVDVNIGNSIWVRDGFAVKDTFIKTNQDMYGAGVFERDFSEQTVTEMNNWISKETNGKIKEMLSPPIKPNVKVFLINAIYFKGDWKDPFKIENTEEETFHVTSESSKTVPMMYKQGTVQYNEGSDYKAIEMPYGEGDTSMYAVLPKEGTTLRSFVSGMTMNKLNTILEGMETQEKVNISFPKFKVEYGTKNLNESLQSLGMKKAFNNADFSGMSDSGLSIDRVLHKAFIEVNEKGSEAAAATVVGMAESASASQPKTFKADHPFLYIIADNQKESILFMGTYYGD
ncbi:serpin family protein [Pontibacillus sp. HMF3514]|uniref:serpin family protein n=1 Tax=Pontibacillus sp. HMF3514 TaxID=2692425 RepID=UPI00131F8D40|nr:serpin family protein [Pontibacillus sp. HMF3514]QHE53480.1 serpin family protein [Pontibacillus sp. HMF3514]